MKKDLIFHEGCVAFVLLFLLIVLPGILVRVLSEPFLTSWMQLKVSVYLCEIEGIVGDGRCFP